MRILLEISYCGTAYHGWQIQPDTPTVQGNIDRALSEIYGIPVHTCGCSRTDAGVHAKSYFCHYDTDKPFVTERLPDALCAHLPRDICVKDAKAVPDDFHCRFDVLSKTYEYYIRNSARRDALSFDRALFYKYPLDEKLLDACAKDFIGTHDFSAFMAQGSPVESTVRTVFDASVTRYGDFVKFTVKGDGFLYNMVRIMVGTLLYISCEKIGREDIPKIIESKDRTLAGPTVSPCGLYLAQVEYKNGI